MVRKGAHDTHSLVPACDGSSGTPYRATVVAPDKEFCQMYERIFLQPYSYVGIKPNDSPGMAEPLMTTAVPSGIPQSSRICVDYISQHPPAAKCDHVTNLGFVDCN